MDHEPTGEVTIARRGVAALEQLRELSDAGIKPEDGDVLTPAQRAALAGWCGWGPLARALNYTTEPPWADLWTRVCKALGGNSRSLDTARNAVDVAFYTPAAVTRAMWDLACGLGFDGTGKVLEPGCGSGRFIAAAPENWDGLEWTGIEADKASAYTAALLNPGAKIVQGRLEKTPLREGSFDLAIGNVPFSSEGVYDPNAPKDISSLHGYFLWRALHALHPGGLLITVCSRYLLDAVTTTERDELARLATFLGAIRLPGSALAPGGTKVVADILVFRRRMHSSERHLDDSWLEPGTDPGYLATPVSPYFLANPDMVLGRMTASGGKQYGMTLDVTLPGGEDLATRLDTAVAALAGRVTAAGLGWKAKRRTAVLDDDGDVDLSADPARDGAYTLHPDGSITQQRDGSHHARHPDPQLSALIRLRDAAVALFAAEVDDEMGNNARERVRQEALRQYQAYTAWYGYLGASDLAVSPDPDSPGETITVRTRPAQAVRRMTEDPDWPTVLAIEIFDDETLEGRPADILLRRVNARAKRKEHTSDPAEALALCLDRTGQADLDVIGEILGEDPQVVPSLLPGQIWEDPENPGTWLPADEYLSGNVRVKLAKARAADEADPGRWAGQVAALEAAQPEDLTPDQINAALGAPWVPAEVIQAFIGELAGSPYYELDQITVVYEPYTATWDIKAGSAVRRRPGMTAVWGTTRVNGVDLIEHACNNTTPTINDAVTEGGKTVYVKNREETALAADKIRDLEERFAEWWAEDPGRADKLCSIYNERFNAVRVRRFDGSLLTFSGLASTFTPYPSQLDMIWRNVCCGTTLCGHVVGAGKAQPMDAQVLTPGGFRRMGDLMTGDEVISVDGFPVPVTGVFPQGPMDVYRVTFSDGAVVECNDEHLWEVTTSSGRAQGLPPRVFTLRELMSRGLMDSKGNPRWAVPLAFRAHFDSGQPRPVLPYLLGLLLGDGNMTHGTVNFTTADDELRQAVQDQLPPGCELISRNDPRRPHDYKLRTGRKLEPGSSQFIDDLYSLGLMGMNARHKHVPQAYKEAPRDVRLAVLRGLMDTDGTVTHSGGAEFSTSSRRLADDVAWLARSLGGIAKVRESRPAARPGSVYYDVTVSVPVNPFRLNRKAGLWRPRSKYPLLRTIVSVERAGVKPMQCIMVDHPRQLYVTDDFVVTHNTFIAVGTAMKLRELGFANKPAMVVPNHLLEQTCAEARRYFPGAKILMVTREDLVPARRRYFAAKCSARDWDLVVMTHQQWMTLPVSPDLADEYYCDLLDELDAAMSTPAIEESRSTSKMLARKRRRLLAKMDALTDLPRDGGLYFEQTGIDYAIVDEAHAYKNLEFIARAEGFNTSGSKRADDMLMKLTWLRRKSEDGRAGMLMTGTPISNSLSELHVLFRYCAPDLLEQQELVSFDGFAAQYIRYQTATEVAPDGGGFRSYRRPRLFVNLPELRSMLWQFADIRTREDLALDGPEVVTEHVIVDGPPELKPFTDALVARADKIRNGQVRPTEDNMLSVCGDGRAAALWMRLVGITPTGPGKIERCAANVARLYHAHKDQLYPDKQAGRLFHPRPGGLQVIFCDMGTPKEYEGGVYDYLKALLAHAGVPEHRIRYIHEAKSHAARRDLFADCRNGLVDVIIGSTEKMGTGVNIQRRLFAIHELDHPWRPADVQQRHGRGDRPGNENHQLLVYRYATKGSFDAYTLQGLERKARFIAQVLTGASHIREVEAVDNPQVLSYGELKAMATGQPLLLMLSEVNSQIARLRNASSGHKRTQARLHAEQRAERERAQSWRGAHDELLKIARRTAESDRAYGGPVLQVHGELHKDGEQIAAVLAERLAAARRNRDPKVKWGYYRGVYLTGELTYYKGGPPRVHGYMSASEYTGDGDAIPVPLYGIWDRKEGGQAIARCFSDAIGQAEAKAAECTEKAKACLARADELTPFLGQPWDGKDELAAAIKRRNELETEIDAQVKDSRKVPQPA